MVYTSRAQVLLSSANASIEFSNMGCVVGAESTPSTLKIRRTLLRIRYSYSTSVKQFEILSEFTLFCGDGMLLESTYFPPSALN